MITLLVVFLVVVVALLAAGVAGLFIFLGLAKANILWTIVEQGWCKIILRWGEYYGTIGPGLHWVGIPGIYTLYRRKMTFLKSMTDKNGNPQAEPHEDKDISSFKTTDYAYAFPFKNEEDSHSLHLSGILAVIAILQDYSKAFFVASDWYSIINTKIMPCFRAILVQISYDDDIVGRDTEEEQKRKTVGERLWEEMNRTPDVGPSIVAELFNLYGIKVKSVELRSVDPPEDWRATTLAPYKAQREAVAAEAVATAESRKAAGPIDIAMEKWVKSEMEEGENLVAAKKRLREIGEYQKQRALLADQINRSRKTVQERKIDITSGGEPLKGGSIASIAGSIAAAIIGATAGKNIAEEDNSGSKNSGGGKGGKKKKLEDMTREERDQAADELEERLKKEKGRG